MKTTVVVGTVLMVSALAVSLARQEASRTHGEPVAQTSTVEGRLRDEIFITEDMAVHADPPGCDSISVYSLQADTVLYQSARYPSPGRLTSDSTFDAVYATRTNGIYYDGRLDRSAENQRDLFVLRRDRKPPFTWSIATLDSPVPVTFIGGIAVANDDEDLLVATNSLDTTEPCLTASLGAEYSLSRFSIRDIDWETYTLGEVRDARVVDSPVAEIIPELNTREVHVLTVPNGVLNAPPRVHTVDSVSLQQVDESVDVSPIGRGQTHCAPWKWPLGVAHATLAPDGRFLVTNRLFYGGLNVVDLEQRTSWTLPTKGISVTGGVAFNHGLENRDLIAVHGIDRVAVYQWHDGKDLELVALREVAPVINPDPVVPGGNVGTSSGPVASIAWSADGKSLVASQSHSGETPEFGVWRLSRADGRLEHSAEFNACGYKLRNAQNDILTGNGLLPTSTPTPTVSPTWTATSTPGLTSTVTPAPEKTPRVGTVFAFLPITLAESCDPQRIRVDVAMVIDASSSMAELTGGNQGHTKLQAAVRAAASFIELLALDSGDQAAIVSFNNDAWLHTSLTASKDELAAALAEVRVGRQTRLDRGISVGALALSDREMRNPNNQAVMIVMTDGRANPVPVNVAVELAGDAKAAGVKVFAIGLGEDLEVEALQKIASVPAFYFHAPTTSELEEVYADVARSIPCPASAYWGRR